MNRTDVNPSTPRWAVGSGLLFLVPALHPLLIPSVGVPSHLLWWVHVLPVAILTFQCGESMAIVSLVVSAAFVTVGEGLFGSGYGVPAGPETILALTFALTGTNLLVASFALYARRVSRRYKLLFDRVTMGVIRVGSDDTLVGANPAAAELLGLDDLSPIIGRLATDVIRVPGLTSLRALEGLGAWTGQIETHGNGSARSLHAFLTAATDPEGGSYQVFMADRSTEVMHEQEIERQSKLSALGEALAGVAHELNNPLAVILAHAQLGEIDAAAGEDTSEVFEIIVRQSRRMRDIVAELVGFSRQEEAVEHAEVDEVLERLVRIQRITLGKAVPIESDLQSDVSLPINAEKIEQIVLNLMSNAAYSIRDGGSRIVVSTRASEGEVSVVVSDDGPGIDPAILERLFEPFATTKPAGEGTGLGLAISRRLARGWGGDLTARNLRPRGAAFELRLPQELPPAVGADTLETDGRTPAAQPGHVNGARPVPPAGRPAATHTVGPRSGRLTATGIAGRAPSRRGSS